MKTMLTAITLAVLSSYASGYDRNRHWRRVAATRPDRGITKESKKQPSSGEVVQ